MTAFETERLTLNQHPFLHSSRDYAVHILIQVLLPVLLQILVPVQNLTQYQIISSSVLVGRRVVGRNAKLRWYASQFDCEFLLFWLRFSLRFGHGLGHGCQYTSITTDRTGLISYGIDPAD